MSYAWLAAAAGISFFAVGCAGAATADAGTSDEAELVGAAPAAWVGNASVAIARDTCGGQICDGDLHAVDGPVVYGTWARERAAVRAFTFEAYVPGITDTRAANLWEKVDVEVHARVAGSADFATHYVGFERWLGNNARYAFDLRTLDPLVGTIGCPATMHAKDGDVEVEVELYVTVNGLELRPAGAGSLYRVRYQNYASLYAGCGG